MTIYIPQCIFCTHWRKDGLGPTCNAFPDGIPEEVLTNGHDHRKKYAGDNGIRFSSVGDVGDRFMAYTFDGVRPEIPEEEAS
jgi:hypothetical protein